jgi:hypothetical protein
MATMLEDAVALIKAGNIEKAKPLLIEFLKENPNHEDGWLWMTRCVTESEQKKYCFEKVLKINPENRYAKEGVARLDRVAVPNKPKPNETKKSPSSNYSGIWILAFVIVGGIFVIGCGVLLFLNQIRSSSQNIPPTVRIPTYTPVVARECQILTEEYIHKVEPLLTEFGDTVKIANSTPRISLPPVIQELQQLRRSISDIPAPRCALGAASLLVTSLDEIINAMISFLGDESEKSISRQFDQGVLDMRNANEQLVALADGRPTPIPQKIPTATPPPPTPMPLPVGSSMTLIDSDGVTWEISVTEIIIADDLKSQVSDDVEKAYGRFAIVFMNLTNRGFSPETFVALGELMIHDSQGNPFGENGMASTYATWIYEKDLGASVNPGETQHIAVVFDISKEGSGYSLMPGPLSNPYQPGILLNIP